MNAFSMTRLLAALFFALFLATGLRAQTEAKKWPITEIKLHRWDIGWELTVRRDGSGSAVYGSSGGDFASFPKGTVDFESLLEAAKTRKIADPNDPERVNVWIWGWGKPEEWNVAKAREMSEDWLSLCRQIQPHLQTGNLERVNDLLKRNPLAKGLPEVPATMEPQKIPQPKRIRVRRGEAAWYVVIQKDGSGCVAHGAAYGVVAWFPKGTVDFGAMVEQAKHRKDADGKDDGVTISIEQTSGIPLDSPDTAADWEALCRKIQPQLQSAKAEQFNQLLKKHPLVKDQSEVPVRPLEVPAKSPAPASPKNQ